MLFTAMQISVSTVSMVSLKTKFEGVPSIEGFNLCSGGLGLCQTVVTGRYIVTYDVILL